MFKKTKNSLAITLSVAMLATMVTIPGVASAATATPLSGADRYATALKIVEDGWTSSTNAVIASGEVNNIADALSAAPLAYAKEKAPILLTKTNDISTEVLLELKDLGVKNVYIVGGTNAVSAAVEKELKDAGLTINRVSGDDRYETSLAIAKEAFGTTAKDVVIANGLAYADALSVSSIAAAKGMPILLVRNTELTDAQKSYIAGKNAYAVGDVGVLNAKVVGTAKRLGGATRYDTNAKILDEFKPDFSKIYLANGTNAHLVDALTGSALAAKTNSPIVLVDDSNKIAPSLATVVKANMTTASTEILLGGKVTQVAADAVEALKSQELEVKSVSAINAKTIEVAFTNAVDAKTLKDTLKADVIKVTNESGAVNPGTITQELSADGMTLTLTAAAYFKGNYTVAVPFETVKGLNGKYVKPINKAVTVNDLAAPVLTSVDATVKATTEKIQLITMTFNEDVASIDTVKINGINYVPTLDGNKATVVVNLDATKAYDVTVVNATDAVKNLKDIQTASLKLTVDNVAPSILNVVSTGENTLKVTLDKTLKNDSLLITGKVGAYTTNVVKTAVVNAENKKEYVVTLDADYLFKNGNSDTVTLTVAKEVLEDSIGNKNAAAITKTVVVTKDAVAPAVAKVENTVVSGKVTGFVVTYNEKVQTIETSKISVVNAKGEILSYNTIVNTPVLSADGMKVTFTFITGITADKYGFDFAEGFVKDTSLSMNKAVKNAFAVDISNAAAPVATTFTVKGATIASNVITVDFGAKVKATATGSALNPASYQINGTVLPSATVINFGLTAGALDQSKVVITLPAGSVLANDTKAIFRVTGVQTLDNKTNAAFMELLDVSDNTAPEAKSFVATTLKTITVTYSENIAVITADIKDEVKLYDTKGNAVAIDSYVVTDGKLVITVADSSAVVKLSTVTSVTPDTLDIKDAAGNVQKAGLTVNK